MIRIKPQVTCVNPVFDFSSAGGRLSEIALDGRPLPPEDYAWDGQTLWLDTDVTHPTTLQLTFETP